MGSFIFGRVALVAGRKLKLSRRDLLLLTCVVHINISVASSFSFFYQRFFMYIRFGFEREKGKLSKGKLYGELRPILKYNSKE